MNVLKSAGERYDSILFHTRHCLKKYFLSMVDRQQWMPGLIGDPQHWLNGVVTIVFMKSENNLKKNGWRVKAFRDDE